MNMYVFFNFLFLYRLSKGCLLNYPMTGVRVKVLDGKFSLKRTNEIAIQ